MLAKVLWLLWLINPPSPIVPVGQYAVVGDTFATQADCEARHRTMVASLALNAPQWRGFKLRCVSVTVPTNPTGLP